MRLFGLKPNPSAQTDHSLLQIKLPTVDNPSAETASLLDAITDIILNQPKNRFSSTLTDHIGLEFCAKPGQVAVYIWLPDSISPAVQKQIVTIYPAVIVEEQLDDYSRQPGQGGVICSGELALTDNELMPIWRIGSHQAVRSRAIMHALGTIAENGATLWLQLLLRPIETNWRLRTERLLNRLRRSNKPGARFEAQAIESKIAYPSFKVKIRLLSLGSDQRQARLNLETVATTFSRFNSFSPNGFKLKRVSLSPDRQLEYHTRLFIDKGFILNSHEVASLFSLAGLATNRLQPDIEVSTHSSAFERLLIEAEAKPKTTRKRSAAKVKKRLAIKPPKGLLRLTAKAQAKQDIGKLATSHDSSLTKTSDSDEEIIIKIHG